MFGHGRLEGLATEVLRLLKELHYKVNIILWCGMLLVQVLAQKLVYLGLPVFLLQCLVRSEAHRTLEEGLHVHVQLDS